MARIVARFQGRHLHPGRTTDAPGIPLLQLEEEPATEHRRTHRGFLPSVPGPLVHEGIGARPQRDTRGAGFRQDMVKPRLWFRAPIPRLRYGAYPGASVILCHHGHHPHHAQHGMDTLRDGMRHGAGREHRYHHHRQHSRIGG